VFCRKKINPIELREELLKECWPAAALVLLGFVSHSLEKSEFALFNHWKELICHEIDKANFEQFFIGLRSLAGKMMFDDARFSTQEYLSWGYLGREVLFNKAVAFSKPMYSLGVNTRREILKSLLEKQQRITVFDYWIAVGKCISRRQAERDLLNFSNLSPVSHTKGRYYIKR
jgi:hypothetical protein